MIKLRLLARLVPLFAALCLLTAPAWGVSFTVNVSFANAGNDFYYDNDEGPLPVSESSISPAPMTFLTLTSNVSSSTNYNFQPTDTITLEITRTGYATVNFVGVLMGNPSADDVYLTFATPSVNIGGAIFTIQTVAVPGHAGTVGVLMNASGLLKTTNITGTVLTPEPACFALAGAALAGLAFLRFRKSKARAAL
jgi:hypothetical protein